MIDNAAATNEEFIEAENFRTDVLSKTQFISPDLDIEIGTEGTMIFYRVYDIKSKVSIYLYKTRHPNAFNANCFVVTKYIP